MARKSIIVWGPPNTGKTLYSGVFARLQGLPVVHDEWNGDFSVFEETGTLYITNQNIRRRGFQTYSVREMLQVVVGDLANRMPDDYREHLKE